MNEPIDAFDEGVRKLVRDGSANGIPHETMVEHLEKSIDTLRDDIAVEKAPVVPIKKGDDPQPAAAVA